jgi:hypothetical protein
MALHHDREHAHVELTSWLPCRPHETLATVPRFRDGSALALRSVEYAKVPLLNGLPSGETWVNAAMM